MLTNAVLRIALMCAVWCGGYSLALAATVTIYDDSLGTLPGAQPWLAYGGTGAASQSVIPTGAQLTTDHNARAGYTNFLQFPSLPALDRSAGFSLDFELQILSEDHGTDNDRAGFSVIVLSSDNLGIEIAFWEDKIWAQSGPGFTHAEEMSYTTTGGETAYSLQILNSGYSLLANGSPILSDALRDYSPFGELPYVLTNYLFLGDNTTSAGADIELGLVELHTMTAIPIPAPALLVLSGLVGFGFYSRRK